MTTVENLCDVCQKNPMIGVASTSVPFSCAFCSECAQQGADPEWIFEYYMSEGYKPEDMRKGLVTYSRGQYMTYAEWFTTKKKEADHAKDPDGRKPPSPSTAT